MVTPPDAAEPGPPAAGHLADAAQLRERIDRSRRRIEAAQSRAQQARATLADSTVTVTSTDHAVTVTVNPAGTLLDVTFGPSAQKLPLPALSHSLLAAYRRAAGDAVERTEAVLRDVLGAGAAPALDLVRASLADGAQP